MCVCGVIPRDVRNICIPLPAARGESREKLLIPVLRRVWRGAGQSVCLGLDWSSR